MLSAGGTGGHVLPALLVAKAILNKQPNIKIIFLGVGTSVEKKLLLKSGFPYLIVESRGVVGSGMYSKFKSISYHLSNFRKISKIIRENSVKAILGFGGYPSFMPLLAGRILGVRTNLFEQNGKAGLANKIASLFVHRVFSVPYSEGLLSQNVRYVLNPVRDELMNLKSNYENKEFRILVLGGSQGAIGMSSVVIDAIKMLDSSNFTLIHQTGEQDLERVKKAYLGLRSRIQVVSYIENMKEAYENSDLVIARAGAGTYGEILAVEKPCIFIPLPISRGHQSYNVKHLVLAGGAMMIEQNEEASSKLSKLVIDFMSSTSKREELVQNLISFKDRASRERGVDVLSNALIEDLAC